jgi:dTDP-4-dehydrorhamnose 3,5-epimerase
MQRSESSDLMAGTAIDVRDLGIDGVKLIKARKFGDHRGFFSETYSRRDFSEAGIDTDFVQDNHSLSSAIHTVRGLHFQLPPFAQDKLVRVIRGSIFDVAVDLRSRSSTYGKYVSAVISADEWNQILVPIGFAHGFMTLEPDTEVIYKVSNYYSPEHDRGILWSDRDLAIDWPNQTGARLSEKDEKLPAFRDLPKVF